jgi:serine/threonine-protein kinase
MDPARYERIQELFHAAADLAGPERREFLASACGADRELLAEVQGLLEEDARASFLEGGLANAAHRVTTGVPAALLERQFGPYRLERLLGEGGMGVVYLGRRDDLNSTAAIKILRDAGLSPARRERFLSEQRTLAQLQHPSIARLYDADTLEDGTPWFAMEYIDGVPLNQYVETRGATISARLRLFRDVCEAVRQAHLRAIIHRDLKPSNILVTAEGGVKLLDFGIAKQLESLDAPAGQTQTALRMMTPAYAAPEQIRGEPVGVYTDVYALGVILYELLAGQLPFDVSNCASGEVERNIVGEEPAKPSAAAARALRTRPSSWADLDVLCLTALHKEPARRYASVEALIRDIDHYLRGEPLEARPDSLGYRLGKFVRRHRTSLSVAAGVAAIVVGLVFFYTVRLTAARNTALAEAARTQRIMGFLLNLFEGGDREAGPANDLRVVQLIDRGVEEARSLSQDPEAQAELYRTLGDVSQKLGNLDRAGTLLQSALDQRRRLFGPSHPWVAESLVDLALLRADQAKFEEAERLAREGLEMARRMHPAGHPAIATATETLGKVLEDSGSYDEAITALEDAVRLRTAGGAAPKDLAGSLFQLANAHFYAGHYAESEKLNQRLLQMYGEIYGPRHPMVAETLINLGAIQQDTGHYAEAEKLHRQALEIVEAFYGAEHAKTASSLTLVARALLFQQRHDEAVSLLNRSLGIRERVYGPDHPQVASTLNELGNIALMRDRFSEAETRFRRIVEIYRKAYNGKHYLIGIGLANLASVYMNSKNFARAEPLFREALAMYAQTLPPGHINVAISRIKLGRTLLRQKRSAEAERETREGYDILSKQSSPAVSWLQAARQDLAEAYDALRQPDAAKRFRDEREAAAKSK